MIPKEFSQAWRYRRTNGFCEMDNYNVFFFAGAKLGVCCRIVVVVELE